MVCCPSLPLYDSNAWAKPLDNAIAEFRPNSTGFIRKTKPDWPRQHEWLAKRLNDMHRVFAQRVRALDAFDLIARDGLNVLFTILTFKICCVIFP
jgi:hypothetical protein